MRIWLLSVALYASTVAAAGASDLVKDLSSAAAPLQSAALKASLDIRLAQQKMINNERVACIGMGRERCSRMIAEDRIKGPDLSGVTQTGPSVAQAKKDGRAAYDTWIVGKKPDQVTAAKKLYAAWLTQLDAVVSLPDPLDAGQSPAGIAYTQAVNEFQIDNPPE
jgi:hypothetical protein